jgi:iron(III) transport system permease protein
VSSVLALERESARRSLLCGLVLVLCLLPAGAFLVDTLTKGPDFGWAEPSYLRALLHSFKTALGVSIVTLAIGLPLAVACSLYLFRGRTLLLGILALPLLIPSFLFAIGLSSFRIALGIPDQGALSAISGTVAAFSSLGLPLVLFASILVAGTMGQSQIDSARLLGGEKLVWKVVLRSVFPFALLASVFAGAMTLGDPGPGQILGSSSVASEILISFSALYDFELASWQCLGLAGVTALLVFPLILGLRRTITQRLFAKELVSIKPIRHAVGSRAAPILLAICILLTIGIPVAGLALGFSSGFPIASAWREVSRTLADTLFYASASAFTATVIGLVLSILVGRSTRSQLAAIPLMLGLFSLPSILGGLGLVRVLSALPSGLDLFLRGKLAAALLLGLRWCPVAFLILLRVYNSTPRSSVESAALHGIALPRYLMRILLPRMSKSIIACLLICALLATADVGLLLLARPPGEDSLPVAIFTVMANAPEALVSSLCLLYILGAVAFVAAALGLDKFFKTRMRA